MAVRSYLAEQAIETLQRALTARDAAERARLMEQAIRFHRLALAGAIPDRSDPVRCDDQHARNRQARRARSFGSARTYR